MQQAAFIKLDTSGRVLAEI